MVMDDIQRRRKNLIFMLSRCEAISNELVENDILPLMEGQSAKDETKKFFETRDELFDRARKNVRDIEFKEMENLEWAIRVFVVGLDRLRVAVLSGFAIRENDFQFYDDFDNAISFSRNLPILKKVKTFLTENRKILQAVSATVVIVAAIATFIARMFFWV